MQVESGLKETKKLDEVIDNRTKMIVEELVEEKLSTMLGILKEYVLKEKHASLVMVDEELNKLYEKVGQNLAMLNKQISQVDMECGTLMRVLLAKKLVDNDELQVEYTKLNKEVEQAMEKMREEMLKKSTTVSEEVKKADVTKVAAEAPVLNVVPSVSEPKASQLDPALK